MKNGFSGIRRYYEYVIMIYELMLRYIKIPNRKFTLMNANDCFLFEQFIKSCKFQLLIT